MYSSVAFNVFTVLFNNHKYLIPEYFYHPPKKPSTIKQSLLYPLILLCYCLFTLLSFDEQKFSTLKSSFFLLLIVLGLISKNAVPFPRL